MRASWLSLCLSTALLVEAFPTVDHTKPSKISKTKSIKTHKTHKTSRTTSTSAVLSSSSVLITTATTASASNTEQSTTLTATAASTKGLQDYAAEIGKYFGTAADIPGTNATTDKYYLAELHNNHDWHQVTPANAMKWIFTEPEQGVFNFTQAEEFLAIAAGDGRLVRCHNLNWYNQNPEWLTSGNWTAEELSAILVNHITHVVEYLGDRCYAWDVVNEALNDTSTGNLDDADTWRQDFWYETLGSSYIETAFKAAEAAVKKNNLKVKLYYNDYNIEYPGNKSTAAQALVSRLKAANVQIDGVGLQSHFIVGETPSTESQQENMAAFVSLGVDVAITELDIRTTVPATEAAQEQQIVDYASTVRACANTAACVGITAWDFDDTYSWIPSTFAGQGYGDLFFQPGGYDTPLVRKAAYDGVIQGLTE